MKKGLTNTTPTYVTLWKISPVLLLALSGCASKPQTEYVTVYKDRPIVCNVPKPVPQNMLYIKLSKVRDENGKWWTAADVENNKKIAINNAKIKKYLADLKEYSKQLLKCIKKEG